jgi:23S rRNA pseudouridine2605 synthase
LEKSGPDKGKFSKSRQGGKERTESSSFGKDRRSSVAKEGKTDRPGSAQKSGSTKGRSFSKEGKSGSFSKEGPKKLTRAASKPKAPGDDSIRLNKFIASSGICSRRQADDLITAGVITVNGKSITELGTKIKPGDDVRYNGKRMKTERKVYLLLNKPKDYVTTTDDPKERKTVMTLIEGACKERIYPVGRLDRQTTGVLLFTNDGELAKKLTHPGYNKKKIYHVYLDKGITASDMKKLAEGLTLEDGFIQADGISYVTGDSKKEVGLEIHSGRNRIVRRMFEHLEYRVSRLDRVYFAGLTKKNLQRGTWRFLSDQEVSRLQMNAYE